MDIKQSALYKENPQNVIETLKKLYTAVGVKEEHATEIIEALAEMMSKREEVELLDDEDDLEEM
jgi:hypothetical protein